MQASDRRLFTTVQTEGALLPADLLGRVVAGDAALKGLTPEDYHLSGERINEATSRAWNRAVGAWAAFQAARARWSAGEPGTSETRERWLLPLFQELGYGRLTTARAIEEGGKSYPVSHVWGHVPIHLVGAGIDLDRRTAGVAGAARTSPHGLVQELLSNADEYLWGFVANGLRLRILRDSVRLSRPAYVEFDLEAMMAGEIYSDFVLLWLLCHESRVEAERAEDCWLERWARVAREQGTRVREDLRDGVQRAIVALGRGFLAHPGNGALRECLRAGALDGQTYYQELLWLVYRLLFLFVAEDRDALLAPNATPEAKRRYADYYSTQRLRHLASRQRGSRHGDLYAMLRLVLGALGDDHGLPELALPSLGSMLFASGAASATPALDSGALANQDLLEAIRALAFTLDHSVRRPVDFRNLGTEELGSVYEALLELHPTFSVASGQFDLETARGNERKTTGSYYTPEGLAAELVKSAVEPVLDAAVKRGDAERAILDLRICDPAVGSGHFLLTAARILAKRLAQARTGDAEPGPAAVRTALRDVISHCVYGVDVNPMAVGLCKVSLWMEALEPGKPLSFLDHHIKCGNSLIGATRALLADGLPDEAFDAVTGDHKAVAREIKRRNKREREGQLKLPFPASAPHLGNLADDYRRLTAMPEDTAEQIHAKQCEYERLAAGPYKTSGRLYADAWCAAFFWPLDGAHQNDAPTEGELRKLEQSPWSVSAFLMAEVGRIACEQRCFHWHLEFPDVFDGSADEGFDCVLGNPPWERIKLQEEEFFAQRAPEIAEAPNAAARKRLIAALPETDPALYAAFTEALHAAEAQSKYFRASRRYPLTARGDINIYSIFAENDRNLIAPRGRMGIIAPTGIATDDTNKAFFGDVISNRALVSLYDFENRESLFPGVHRSYKFCLLTLTGDRRGPERADVLCFALRAEDLLDTERHLTLTPADFALINPNTRTLPIFRSRRDADLTRQMYRAAPVLVDESGPEPVSPWGISFVRMFDMSNDSALFRTRAQLEQQGYALGSDGGFRLTPGLAATPSPAALERGPGGEAMERGLRGEARRALCRELRRRGTPAEEVFWELVRDRRFNGYKFRRQHPLGTYIADFYSPELRLVVELDGGVHRDQVERDRVRDEILTGYQLRVIRIPNHDMLADPEAALERIERVLATSPSPSALAQGHGPESATPLSISDGEGAGGEADYLPLYEAKLFHQFDHRFATFAGGPAEDKARDTSDVEHADPRYMPTPRYWVPRAEVERALGAWCAPWLLAFRKITPSTNERTCIASCLARVGVGDNASLLLLANDHLGRSLCLLGNLNALPFDYAARNKVGGINLNFFLVKQLPVLPPKTYERRLNGERLAEWVTRRALELTYTSYDLAPLARDLGYEGPPFAWDEARHAELRGELDGLYAHLYGLSRDDFAYILTTFPVLQRHEERKYGEYRTARLALAAYDALAPLLAAEAGVGSLKA